MARTAGASCDTLLARVRQAGNIAVDQDFAMSILSKCQRVVNAGLRRILASASLTTAANTLLYKYRSSLTSAVDIIIIKEGDRILQKCTNLSDLAAYDVDWFTKTGSRFEAWMQFGRDVLILYPAKTSTSSVTVTYSKLLTSFSSYASDYTTALELPDEDADLAIGLAEIVLLLRNRQLDVVNTRLNELGEQVKKHLEFMLL